MRKAKEADENAKLPSSNRNPRLIQGEMAKGKRVSSCICMKHARKNMLGATIQTSSDDVVIVGQEGNV